METYQPIPNPYYAGGSLPEESGLFFGHEDVIAFIAEYIAGPRWGSILLLIGQRKTGKSSLLKQLSSRLDKRYVVAFIDGQVLGSEGGMAHLFYDLSDSIASSLSTAGVEFSPPALADFEQAPSHFFERKFLARVEAALGNRRLLLVLDEFEEIEMRVREGRLDPTVFGHLRHVIQYSKKLVFILVGTHRLEELTKEYWSLFLGIAQVKQIRFLDFTAACRLIREPAAGSGLVYDDLAVARILDFTAGHPYFVQLMCFALVNSANVNRRRLLAAQDVQDAAVEAIGLGEAHFLWLWNQMSPKEQLVMAALTALPRELGAATSGDVSDKLAEYGQHMDAAEVSVALGTLAAEDLVEEIPNHILRYRFKLGIVCLWIQRNKPLSRVIEDVTVRGPRQMAMKASEPDSLANP